MYKHHPLVEPEADPRSKILDVKGKELCISRDFSAEEFKQRRDRVAEYIGAGACALVPAGGPDAGSYGGDPLAKIFYYLTGLTAGGAYLLIDGADSTGTLFLSARARGNWTDDEQLQVEDADMLTDRMLLDRVLHRDDLSATLKDVKTLHVLGPRRSDAPAPWQAEDPWDRFAQTHHLLPAVIHEAFLDIKLESLWPVICELRSIKSPAEIEVMRHAGYLAARALVEAMKATRPGIGENKLQAIASYVFHAEGCTHERCGVTAASGRNTWNGHYSTNNCTLQGGDVVLMDTVPTFRRYSMDIARVWPVNGTYSEWQRRVYGFIVEYHKALMNAMGPGRTPPEIYEECAEIMRAKCDDPALPYGSLRPMLEGMIKKNINYINHAVGLNVHDAVLPYRDKPLQVGMVLVVDPMVWCEEEHLYIRCEDTVVVTEDGVEVLTGYVPIELEEVERLMKEPSAFDDMKG